MAASNNMCACGMHLCGKCSPMTVLFGLLFLIQGLGLFTASWFTFTTIFGLFFLLWGAMSMMKM